MIHPDITSVTLMWPYQKEFADENKNVHRVTQNSPAFYIQPTRLIAIYYLVAKANMTA